MEITSSIKKKFPVNPTTAVEEEVELQISNTLGGFGRRLVIKDQATQWSKSYDLILTLRSAWTGKLYGTVTTFYEGSLPIEQPFEILTGN
jgi:hypothetical protein